MPTKSCWRCGCGYRRAAITKNTFLTLFWLPFVVLLFTVSNGPFVTVVPYPLSAHVFHVRFLATAEASLLPSPILVTFGYLRMASDRVDTSSLLGAYLATVKLYNVENRAPGVEFSIDATTIPCFTMSECVNLTAPNAQMVDDFVAKMPSYTAILRPNFLLSTRLVDEARRIGIPVMNPQDMRPMTFSNISENVIQFHQRWRSQSEHLFTYMHQTERCAFSAIIHDASTVSGDYGYATRIESVQKLFTDGRFPEPPALDVPSASDEAFKRFFMEDTPRRRCFFVMGTSGLMSLTMERLIASDWYIPENYLFYGMSTMASDFMKVNGSAHHFANTVITHWAPPLESPTFERAYSDWLHSVNGGADAMGLIGPNETFPSKPTFSMLQGYMVTVTTLEAVRDAISRSMLLVNASMPRVPGKPLPWSDVLDSLYRAGTQVEGHWFNHLVRRCPAPPAPQDNCFCNTMTANSYIYYFNTTTGAPYVVNDDERTGLRNVADQRFPNECGYQVSSWSYPITGLALFPTSLIAEGGFREGDLLDKYRIFESTFAELTRETNYAPTPPTRALSYAAFKIDDGVDEQKLLEQYIDTIKPFVIYGTMGKRIRDPKGVLTLASSLVDMAMEDPPLVPHSEWRWDIITLRPAQADFIHALVSYLARNRRVFTSVHAIATSLAEAELVSKSFATWGFNVPVSAVVVATGADVWNEHALRWLSNPSSDNPFVLATSNMNSDSEVQRVAKTASQLNRGVLAIACSVATSQVTSHVLDFPSAASSGGDVIFGSFVREWWLPSALEGIPPFLHQHVRSSTFHIALLSVDVAKILMAQVYFDYVTTAAEVLYKLSFITAQGASFGPFSNESCTEEQIARNARDRACQCTKGIRTTYVMSMRDYLEGVTSARTERYAWTMTTCGVLYTPYVDPMAGRSQGGASLSTGATAGVVVGSIIFVLGIIGVAIFLALTMSGRNNAKAPKDASRPFTIVFTDIQSSTALWARAPSAMSEAVDQHHRIIRRCIGRNSGYEVKTVGDCFMVAFKNVNDAVAFAIEVQLRLVENEWNSEIDATYVELLLEAEDCGGELREEGYADGKAESGGERRNNNHNNDNNNQRIHNDGREEDGFGSDRALKSCGASGVLGSQQHRKSIVAVSYYSATHFNALANIKNVVHNSQHVQPHNNYNANGNNTSNFNSYLLGAAVLGGVDENGSSIANLALSTPADGGIDALLASSAVVGDLSMGAQSTNNRPRSVTVGTVSASDRVGGRMSPLGVGGEEGGTSVTPEISPRNLLSGGGGKCYTDSSHLTSREVSPTNVLPANFSNVKTTNVAIFPSATSDVPRTEGNLAKFTATEDASQGILPRQQTMWHGLRVRIGVHHGMGDIRKDPVTLGYDYYGTVVNTASRVEGVGHGGQILVTEDVFISLGRDTIEQNYAVAIALGPQPLRGLDEPIKLYQVLPRKLQGRLFPPLRLHIEKETEEGDTSVNTTTNGTRTLNPTGENNTQYTSSSLDTEKFDTFIARICSMRQYSASLSVEDLSDRHAFFTQLFSTATPKYKMSVVAKLAELWSLDKSAIAAASGSKASDGDKMRAVVSLMAKVTKAFNVLTRHEAAHVNKNSDFAAEQRSPPPNRERAPAWNFSITDGGGSRRSRSRSRSSQPSRLYASRPGGQGFIAGSLNIGTLYGGEGSASEVFQNDTTVTTTSNANNFPVINNKGS